MRPGGHALGHAAVDERLHVGPGSTSGGHELGPGLVGLGELVHGLVRQHVVEVGTVVLVRRGQASRRPHLEEQNKDHNET